MTAGSPIGLGGRSAVDRVTWTSIQTAAVAALGALVIAGLGLALLTKVGAAPWSPRLAAVPSTSPGAGDSPGSASVATPAASSSPSLHPATVQKTFRLTVLGHVPGGVTLTLVFDVPGAGQTAFELCPGAGGPPCVGGGHVYTYGFANLPYGGPATYSFERYGPGGLHESFGSGTDPMAESSTISADYTFK